MSESLGIHDEVRTAFLPRTVRVGGCRLHAPCMGHLLAMSRVAPDILARSVPVEQVAAAAGVLAVPPEKACAPEAWAAAEPKGLRQGSGKEVLDAILGLFAEAFDCHVPAGDPAGPSGLGWWLELYYFAASDLRMDHHAILACPLARLFALSAASSAFNGHKFREPSYAERCTLRELGDPPPGEEAP